MVSVLSVVLSLLVCWFAPLAAAQEGGVSGLELSWGAVPDSWRPGTPCPLELTLRNGGEAPVTLQHLRGPNPALAFSLGPADGEPAWHAGREVAELAGVSGGAGLPHQAPLGPGQAWTTQEELASYWLPPAPGRYQLRARFRGPAGELEAPARTLEVLPAQLQAVGVARVQSSEDAFLSVWGDGDALWLRLAGRHYPLAPRWQRSAGSWPGKGSLRLAQHAFSPTSDPPLAAYAFWAVWLDAEGRLGGNFSDAYGAVAATVEPTDLEQDRPVLLQPLQREDGELFVPVLALSLERPVLRWWRVAGGGGRPELWADWPLPEGAQLVTTFARPEGTVGVAWCDAARHVVTGSLGPLSSTPPGFGQLAERPKGRIEHLAFQDLRDGKPTLLTVERDGQRVRTWVEGPQLDQRSAWVALPHRGAVAELRAGWHARGGAVIALRDDAGALWLAAAEAGAEWTLIKELGASQGFGVEVDAESAVCWGADPELGLRFLPFASFSRRRQLLPRPPR